MKATINGVEYELINFVVVVQSTSRASLLPMFQAMDKVRDEISAVPNVRHTQSNQLRIGDQSDSGFCMAMHFEDITL